MKFSQDNPDDGFFIQRYDERRIIIRDRGFDSSLVICPDEVIENWPPSGPAELEQQHLDAIVALRPEVVLIGTGTRLVFPAIEVYAGIIQGGVGVEIMDTGAACRTYNILMGEGRRVVAGLMLQAGGDEMQERL